MPPTNAAFIESYTHPRSSSSNLTIFYLNPGESTDNNYGENDDYTVLFCSNGLLHVTMTRSGDASPFYNKSTFVYPGLFYHRQFDPDEIVRIIVENIGSVPIIAGKFKELTSGPTVTKKKSKKKEKTKKKAKKKSKARAKKR